MIQRVQITKTPTNIKNNYKKMWVIPHKTKEHYNSVIPLTIYQTWHTKILSDGMQSSVSFIKHFNPEFSHELYDDDDCANFIKNNFSLEVYNAFNGLIPGAYKADLWRYCILYKRGGIYLDIKYKPINEFKFITVTEKEHWVLDMDGKGIYNALIVSKAGNPILLKAINNIVKNVQTRFYGTGPLEPTGPLMLSKFFTHNEKQRLGMKHDYVRTINNRFIYLNNRAILRSYDGYIQDHTTLAKNMHYSDLWHENRIYNII